MKRRKINGKSVKSEIESLPNDLLKKMMSYLDMGSLNELNVANQYFNRIVTPVLINLNTLEILDDLKELAEALCTSKRLGYILERFQENVSEHEANVAGLQGLQEWGKERYGDGWGKLFDILRKHEPGKHYSQQELSEVLKYAVHKRRVGHMISDSP